MKQLIVCLLLLGGLGTPLLAQAAVGSAAVNTWYVRPSGACANNGDGLAYGCAASAGASGAFITFANIIWTTTTGVDDGDTLYVCGAHTTGMLRIDAAGGASGLPIVVNGACPSDHGTVITTSQANGTDAIQVIQQSWVTIRDFDMLSAKQHVLHLYNGLGTAMTGISIVNNTIDNRAASATTFACFEIYAESASGGTYTKLTITGNTLLGTTTGCATGINHAIAVFLPTADLLIGYNTIYDTSGDGVTTSGANGTNLVIVGNRIAYARFGGIKIQHATYGCTVGIKLLANVVINSSWGIQLLDAASSTVANNTLINYNDGDVGGAGPTFGALQIDALNGCAQTGNIYLNNIIMGNYAPGVANDFDVLRATFESTTTWNGNVFYQLGAQTTLLGFNTGGNSVTLANFSTWQASHLKDRSQLPTFQNSTACTSQATAVGCKTSDWRLATGSPLIGAGVTYAGCVDIAGLPCPNPPDIGAYQVAAASGPPWAAASCSRADVVTAIGLASTGETVTIPACAATAWATPITLTKGITIQGAGTTSGATLTSITGYAFLIQPAADLPVRVTAIAFSRSTWGSADYMIEVYGTHSSGDGGGARPAVTQVRIDHCTFLNGGRQIHTDGWVYGLIDHNTFTDGNIGIGPQGDNSYSWLRPIVPGTIDALFIEDNTFVVTNARVIGGGAGAVNEQVYHFRGARSVVRDNVFNYSALTNSTAFIFDTHGNGSSAGAGYCFTSTCAATTDRGQPLIEVYDNRFTLGGTTGWVFKIRGGTMLIHDNIITTTSGTPNVVTWDEEEGRLTSGFVTLRTTWPAQDQTVNTFFWTNTVNGVPLTTARMTWTAPATTFVQQNRDFWMHAPESAASSTPGFESYTGTRQGGSQTDPTDGSPYALDDGHTIFTATGANAFYPYTTFTYPHPLQGAAIPPVPRRFAPHLNLHHP